MMSGTVSMIDGHFDEHVAIKEIDKKIIIAMADTGMNEAAVARAVFMHRNSIEYHLSAIERQTGLDPKNFYDLARLVMMVKGRLW